MFASRDRRRGSRYTVDVAFTDRWGGVSAGPYESLDLTRDRPGATVELSTNRTLLAEAFVVEGLVTMRQVHGADVRHVERLEADQPTCDGLVTTTAGLALCVRAGDCVPLVLADVEAGVVAVAHVGRPGVVVGIVSEVVAAAHAHGARDIEAWIGPHVCGGCYEVPAAMRDDVSNVEPAAFCCTTWGTPSVDIGAAVVSQLRAAGCRLVNESELCTRESEDLYSHRRQGAASGRLGGLVVLRQENHSDQLEPSRDE